MPLNIQTLKTRTLTAVVFVMVMMAGLLWNQWSFFLLFSIIHFGCWFEYQRLMGLIDPEYRLITSFHKYAVMLAGWCIMLYATNNDYHVGGLTFHAIGWWLGLIFIFVLPLAELLFAKELSLKNIGYSLVGIVYISLSWGLLLDLRHIGMSNDPQARWWQNGRMLPLFIIFCMWVNDTMAYMIGSVIGKTPFSPISPKKTWEGTIGGVICCIALMGFAGMKLAPADFPVQGYQWFIIAAICAITGTAGDLLESKLKRMANVKDSGQIMPGHGGFLDRFDSLILATPFVWLCVYLFLLP